MFQQCHALLTHMHAIKCCKYWYSVVSYSRVLWADLGLVSYLRVIGKLKIAKDHGIAYVSLLVILHGAMASLQKT